MDHVLHDVAKSCQHHGSPSIVNFLTQLLGTGVLLTVAASDDTNTYKRLTLISSMQCLAGWARRAVSSDLALSNVTRLFSQASKEHLWSPQLSATHIKAFSTLLRTSQYQSAGHLRHHVQDLVPLRACLGKVRKVVVTSGWLH